MDKNVALEKIEKSLQVAEETIKKKNGHFKMIEKARIIGQNDVSELDDIIQ